ncbi:protein-arginine deiminase (PAD) domain-containing protein [Sarocladium implicatum]|nr:protein-arginine deiminase (PAD) domain-containing protein [Sarocladium implicatum]
MRSVLVAGLALGNLASATLKPVILADHNFDGVVDPTDDSDNVSNKCKIGETPARFLPAITDTDRRCSKLITAETLDADFEKCHDSTDDVLRHPERLAPIRTRPVKGAAGGSITVSYSKGKGGKSLDKIRLFKQVDGEWSYHSPEKNNTFTGEELAAGLVLGIDGRDVIRPNGWDGRVRINFNVWEKDPSDAVQDCIHMQVSPILTHHHAQTAERVFSAAEVEEEPAMGAFVEDIKAPVAAAGVEEPIHFFDRYPDRWTQDFFEPGYTSIAGPDGPISIRVLIRSVQDTRTSGRAVFEDLRDDGVGAIQDFTGSASNETLESTGNLETIPPHSNGNKKYPAGRVIQGSWYGDKPHMSSLLQAQGVQDPLSLDTSWLFVGHVDEFLQFLPADNERGWILMADDPEAGMRLLTDAVANGYGNVTALSRPEMAYDGQYSCMPDDSIEELLELMNFKRDNEHAATKIEQNLALLKRETGLTDDDIYRVPALFAGAYWDCNFPGFCDPDNPEDDDPDCVPLPEDGGSVEPDEEGEMKVSGLGDSSKKGPKSGPKITNIVDAAHVGKLKLTRRQEDDGGWIQTVALYPGIVNGLVLPNKNVLAPNPWGPVIDGEDILAAAANKVYAAAGHNVTYIDDYYTFHVGQGEVHCGTNSWREKDKPWW